MDTDTPASLFDFADQLALVSIGVMRYRLRNKATLPVDQRARLEALEGQLDTATASVRAQGIAALASVNAAARGEIEAATVAAQNSLARIRKVERVVDIASSVLGLATAASTGSSSGILSALKTLKDAAGAGASPA